MIGLPEMQVVDIKQVMSPHDDADSEIEVLRSRVLAAKVIKRLNLLKNPEFNPALSKPEKSFFDFTRYLNPLSWVPASWKKTLKEATGQETERAVPPPPASPEEKEEQQHQALMSAAISIFLDKLKLEQIGLWQCD